MLFLFNDVVFDLGDLTTLLSDGELPLPASELDTVSVAGLTHLIQEAIFMDQDIGRNKPKQVMRLAALFAYRAPGANALLALPNPGATGPDGVGIRFANVPITTLAYLWSQQQQGLLTANEINQEVWMRVVGSLHTVT